MARGRKAQEIVWTKYLSERTLLKAWHILENNYFKGAIKKIRENGGEMSYAMGHNSLYMGIYFGDGKFNPTNKPLPKIREQMGIPKRTTISNVMPPHEVLKNIHAMHIAGQNLLEYVGKCDNQNYSLYKVCHHAGQLASYEKVDIRKVNEDSRSLQLVQPNCYKYVKKIKRDLALGKPIGTVYGEGKNEKLRKFQTVLSSYKKMYENFVNELQNHGIFGKEKQNACLAELDNGLYCTMLGNVGFDINEHLSKEKPNEYISRKELVLHTRKLKMAIKTLEKTNETSFNGLKNVMLQTGQKLRADFIYENKNYPECGKGFYNALANVLTKNMEYVNIFDESQTKNYPNELKKIMQKMARLEQVYEKSNSEQEKQQIIDKINEISDILEKQ
jgi:hypothetical protein